MTSTNEDKSSRFRVLHGHAQPLGGPRASLTVIPTRFSSKGEQMAFPCVLPARACIISAPIACLSRNHLGDLLTRLSPRKIVDIRLSASFERLGASRDTFLASLTMRGIEYIHMQGLSNRFVGQGHRAMSRFREALQAECAADLMALRRSVELGPVVLASVHRYHTGSDREVIVELLHAVRGDFELIILDEP